MSLFSNFMRCRFPLVLFALFLCVAAGGTEAHDIKAGTLVIMNPWARATPPGAQAGGGYVTIQNDGTESDRLIAASMDIAGKVEVHEMKMEDGVAQMRPLKNGLEVPAGGMVELKPGSYHLMIMQLARPLKEGDSIKGTLTFEKAGTVDVTFAVGPIGSSRAPEHDHGAMAN